MQVPFRDEREETDRLPTLTDGVIAIVITLLVLDISVPDLPPSASTASLVQAVLAQWQDFVGFVLSFFVIGFYWVLHRRLFLHIDRHDRGVVGFNFVFLLFVAFVPYATSMFTTYPRQFGIVFLSATLSLTGLTLAFLWVYASRRNFLESALSSRTVQIQGARLLASPLVFLFSALVALVDPTLAVLSWLLLIPINGVLQSRFLESIEESSRDTEVGT